MINNRGFITLLSVLLIGAVGFSIGAALLWFGVGNSKTSLAMEQSTQARWLSDACAEEALEQVRGNTDFFGQANIILGDGTCTYTVIKFAGENRQITILGTVGTITRKEKIILDAINPQIHIISWQEVPDF
ncbi:MAG: hypothetical protein EXS55_01020 [Candidatus Magasanikbacteria bacterium]|nr:hypothetical protein [Candidatus Magasanikbacteria bacterium]